MAKETVAGKGTVEDPKKAAYHSASSYKPHEDVNAGPHGGKKGGVTEGHGQSSDDPGSKDKLVSQTLEQKDPYKAKGSDFPVTEVKARTGQSGKHGDAEGHNDLVAWKGGLESPRTCEDDGLGEHGSGTPVPGDRAARVAAHFSIEISKGESEMEGGEIGITEYVNLQTGHVEGGSQTVVGEVPQYNVSIGR